MISITGGFNQQFSSGTLNVAKEKLVRDSMTFSDAIELYSFASSLGIAGDFFNMLDALGTSLGVQHFNEPVADSFEFTDAVETSLAEA